MKYTKPPKTFDQQADLLLSRGMVADRELLVARLSALPWFQIRGW